MRNGVNERDLNDFPSTFQFILTSHSQERRLSVALEEVLTSSEEPAAHMPGIAAQGLGKNNPHPADAGMVRRDPPPLWADGSTCFAFSSHRARLFSHAKPQPRSSPQTFLVGKPRLGKSQGRCCVMLEEKRNMLQLGTDVV